MDVRVRFLPSEKSVSVAPGTTLLDAARRAGLPLAGSCGADGICGRCGLIVLAGAETLSAEDAAEAGVKHRNRVDASMRLACRARLRGDVSVSARYW